MLLEAPFQIYSAAAGSGKTYTLAKTYLSLLLRSNSSRPFQHILAITFTNKAAAEMKERVLSSLHYFAHRSDQSDPVKEGLLQELSEGLSLSSEHIRGRSKTLLKEILHNYSAFELTTIDAFTHKLIRSFALDLALNPGFEVTLEPHSYLKEAIERLIDQIQEDPILKRLLRTMTFEQIEQSKSFDISYQLFEFSKELLNERSRKKFEQNQIELAQIAQHTAALKRELEHLHERIANRAQSLLNALQEAGGNSVFKINILDNLGAMAEGRLDESKLFNETVIRQIEQSTHFKKGKEPSQSLLEHIEQEYPELIDLLR
jgi:ATP-dependent exoDNAse (exonuclease V) beta subunit